MCSLYAHLPLTASRPRIDVLLTSQFSLRYPPCGPMDARPLALHIRNNFFKYYYRTNHVRSNDVFFRKAVINLARIQLQGILIIFPNERRRLLAIIVWIEPISINFDLTIILVILSSLTSSLLICKLRRRHGM